MTLIKKLFIKNYTQTESATVRLRYGAVASCLGLISNILFCALKLIVGLISGSITIIADAVNNLSDAGSSVVTLIGFKLSGRPADKEHPYGHARYEYITALIVAFVVLAIGLVLGKSAIEKIITPTAVETGVFAYIVLGIAIFGKLWQMLLYKNFGKAINSTALVACAADSRNDIISTVAVLIATAVQDIFDINIDGYAGVAVSLFILISGISLVRDIIDPLLGTVPDKTLVDRIKDKLMSYDGVLGIHDLMVHNYGAAHVYAIVHVEVSSKVDVMISHDLMDVIERDFLSDMDIHLSIHMDPVETDNPLITELHDKVLSALKATNSAISMHDFRVVVGVTHTNILFDAVLPYSLDITKDAIENITIEAVADGETTYYVIVNIDREYT